MEVRKGYKQTDIGVIPSDWEVKKLGEIVDKFVNGGTPSTNDIKFWNGNIPWITGADILNQKVGEIRRYITKDAVRYSSTNIINAGKLLLVSRTGVGKLAITPFDIAISQDFTGIYGKDNLVNTDYLFHFFDFKQNVLKSQNQGTSIQGITRETLSSIQIPLPPTRAEQTAIATALSDADALITSLEKLVAKKRLIKQGAMQELLSSTGSDGKPKEGWVVKKLGEVCKYQNGTSLEKYFNNRDGFKVISIGNYSPFGKFVITNSFIDRRQESIISKFILRRNDLTMILNDKTAVGTIIGRVLLIEEDNQYVFNQRTMRLIPKSGIEPSFLYHKINSDEIHNKIVAASKPGTQIYVNTNDIVDMEILLPNDKAEQSHIAAILSDMDAEITALEAKLEKYRKIKLGMMQELLTGKIRLYQDLQD